MAEDAPGARNRSAPGVWFVLAPAIALVVGLVLGGLIVWAGQNDSDGATAVEETAAPSPTPTATAAGEDTQVIVPSECLEAAETLQAATDVFADLASAVRDFRAGDLRDLLRQLEELEADARSQADACQQVQVNSTSAPSPTA